MTHPVLVGVEGWNRWSLWAAHFYVNGEHLCDTVHGQFMGGGFEPKPPTPAPLAPSGDPYGRVCQKCLKLSRKRQRETRP